MSLRKILKKIGDKKGFNFKSFKNDVFNYLETLKIGDYEYAYSETSSSTNLYNSVFACLTYGLLGEFSTFSDSFKKGWVDYFNMHLADDGLFYDKVIESKNFLNNDDWGARHLSVLINMAIIKLGYKPQLDFLLILKKFDKSGGINNWLDQLDWSAGIDFTSNEVMNYGALMQYSRDYLKNDRAGFLTEDLKTSLIKRVNKDTGMWGGLNINIKDELSKSVQAAYHFWTILLYDGVYTPELGSAVDNLLHLQNQKGGFASTKYSSACEDIDAIFPLVKFCNVSGRGFDINRALRKAFKFVLSNQNKDGGFIFKRNSAFTYGHELMSTKKNESSIFATWFRTLTIAYLVSYFKFENGFVVNRMPGYEF